MSLSSPSRWLRRIAAAGIMLVLAALAFGYAWMRAGLAQLDGPRTLAGLGAAVTVQRDALGVPTIRAQSRADAARALGYLHAQDRFFQMDLMRRHAAGELAELFGKAAVESDKAVRIHEFRQQAAAVYAGIDAENKTLLDAYAAGVNAGLHDLRTRPFEYLVLRAAPMDWQPEDSLLVGYAMVLDLEDPTGRYQRTLAALTSAYGFVGADFFAPVATPDDAALDGSVGTPAPIPNASVIDLRTRPESASNDAVKPTLLADDRERDRTDLGSNTLAVDGAHAGGSALIGNDMHLSLGVPNTWYRAQLVWPGHTLTGTTLPGLPLVVAGSNGHIAWGWSVAYPDMGDLVAINTELTEDMYYGLDHKQLIRLETRHSLIKVKGGAPQTVDYTWSIWGPIVSNNGKGRLLAYQWVFDRPGNLNLALRDLEGAASVTEALAIGRRSALPALNLMVGDSQGHIGWTVVGALPKRHGFTGRTPVTFAFNDRGWNGVLSDAERPSVTDSTNGYLWTGNNRSVGGAGQAALGDGGPARPARARQLRDDLQALVAKGQPAKPADLLAIQLDDRAIFLEPWRQILLKALSGVPESSQPDREAIRGIVADHWEGRADIDSASYRLVRAFRLAVAHRVFDPIYAKPVERDAIADWVRVNYEAPLRQILDQRPAHLLSYEYGSWDDLLLKAVDDVAADLKKLGLTPATATWGRRNRAAINHPFGLVLPHWLVGWLGMKAEPLPGDADMPRVQGPAYGASERFAVSPGHEEQGIFEMPGGQSANPLSPYYRAGHEAWAHGEPSAFLPGAAEHTLTLEPAPKN